MESKEPTPIIRRTTRSLRRVWDQMHPDPRFLMRRRENRLKQAMDAVDETAPGVGAEDAFVSKLSPEQSKEVDEASQAIDKIANVDQVSQK